MPKQASSGEFVWYDLMTNDPAGAQDFYYQADRMGDPALGWR